MVIGRGVLTTPIIPLQVLHDYEHKGVTNDHLVNTSDHLAAVYNDRAPHENHHASAGLLMLAKAENNFLVHLPKVCDQQQTDVYM